MATGGTEFSDQCNKAVNSAKNACSKNGIPVNLIFTPELSLDEIHQRLKRVDISSTADLKKSLRELQRIAKAAQSINDYFIALCVLEKLHQLRKHPNYNKGMPPTTSVRRRSGIPVSDRSRPPRYTSSSIRDRVRLDLEKYKKEGAIKKKTYSDPTYKPSTRSTTLPKHLLPAAYGCSMSITPMRTGRGHAHEMALRIKPRDPPAPSRLPRPITSLKLKEALEKSRRKK